MGHRSFWSCEGVLQSETLLPMDSFSHRTWPGRPLQGTTLLSPSCCCCSLSLRCKFRKCTTETCMFVKKNCLLFLCGLTGFTNVSLIMQPWVVWWQINHINKPSWTLKSVHRQTETETPDTVLQTAAVVVPTSERCWPHFAMTQSHSGTIVVFLFSATWYFHSTTFWRTILYFLLLYTLIET